MTLTIEITSDFICPWCWVADARLNQAIAQLKPSTEIKRIWYPFELNPTMPEAGIDRQTYQTSYENTHYPAEEVGVIGSVGSSET